MALVYRNLSVLRNKAVSLFASSRTVDRSVNVKNFTTRRSIHYVPVPFSFPFSTAVPPPNDTASSSTSSPSSSSPSTDHYAPDINPRSYIPSRMKKNPRRAAEMYREEFEHSSSSEEIVAIERSDIDPYTLETTSINTGTNDENYYRDATLGEPTLTTAASETSQNDEDTPVHTLPADLAAKVRKHAGRDPVHGSSRERGGVDLWDESIDESRK